MHSLHSCRHTVRFVRLLTLLLIITLLSGCRTAERILYLQDLEPEVAIAVQEARPITLKTGDRIRIVVHSRDVELAAMFNLQGEDAVYTVDADGCIDFPILGLIPVSGLTRLEVGNQIKYKLLAGKLLRDPIVTVEYTRISFDALGELGHRGHIEIDRDCITLLQAIAASGDLTLQGRRDNVLVLRQTDGRLTPYYVDLTSTESILSSPAYYIQQDDIIYVSPNRTRTDQSTQNASLVRTPGFWISMFSFSMTLFALFR